MASPPDVFLLSGKVNDAASFLIETAAALSLATNQSEVAGRLAAAAIEHFCDAWFMHVIEDDGVTLIGSADSSAVSALAADNCLTTARLGIVHETLRMQKPVRYDRESAGRSDAGRNAAEALQAAGARSLIVVPLVVGATSIGTLTFIEAHRPNAFREEDVAIANAVSRQVSLALENIQLREQQRYVTQKSRFLANTSDELLSSLDPSQILQILLDATINEFADVAVATGFSAAGLFELATASKDNTIKVRAGTRVFDENSEQQFIDAIAGRRSILVGTTSSSNDPLRSSVFGQMQSRAWMMVPLTVSGQRYGAVACFSTGRSYAENDLDVLEELCRRATIALENAESFARERRLTQTLQKATLPSHLAEPPGAHLSAVYMPASSEERVGGDWYDAFALDDHRFLITIGDVTGHGVQASVIMGKLRHALNVVAMYESDLVKILDVTERIVLHRYPDAIATAFIAILDTQANSLTYANAGHPYPIVRYRDGSTKQLVADGLPIGVRALGTMPAAGSASLADAELVLFYTDGIVEEARDAIEGERRLLQTLENDAATLVSDTAEFVRSQCIGESASDDVAILALNFARVVRWQFASGDRREAQRVRHDAVDEVRRQGCSEEVAAATEAILGELIANIVQHAPGLADIVLQVKADRLVLHAIDRGRGWIPTKAESIDASAETGRGLWLIRRLGGSIELGLLPGFGAHARITLPVN
jgi:serine phosphatase RsbU (regulator of sigma subunit)